MNKILILYNPSESHHHYRMEQGLRACNLDVVTSSDLPKNFYNFDYIFVEHAFNKDLSDLQKFKGVIIPFDVEDKANFFSPKIGFNSIKDLCTVYAKYNYQPDEPNPTGLKLIASPQVDYIYRGALVAQQIYTQKDNIKKFGDVFLFGSPTFITEYTPKKNCIYTKNDEIDVCPKRLNGDDYLYHQRLEWLYMLSKSKIKFSGGLHFSSSNNLDDILSLNYQSKQFGKACGKFLSQMIPTPNYYGGFLSHSIAPCPGGIARSSYRIIELMALGRIILQTDMEGYRYLYNPEVFITIPDGANIIEYIEKCIDEEKLLLEESRKNVELFAALTPEKMWKDFLSQI